MPDIFDEVEEDLRADRAQRALRRYGGLLAGALLLGLLGVAGVQGWRWYEARGAAQAAEGYLAATRAASETGADLGAAADRLSQVATAAPAGYRTLARLRAAALKAESGDRPGALSLWDQVARDSEVDPLYRDLATLLWGLHSLDTGDPAAVEARLAPLAAAGPWRASAREVRALATLKRGDGRAAREAFQALSNDEAVPQGVRERAGRMLSGLPGTEAGS